MDNHQLEKLMSASAIQQAQLMNDSLPDDGVLDQIIPTEAFNQKMQEIIAQGEKIQKRHKSQKRLGKLVASFIVVLGISFGVILSADASRSSFLYFFERCFSIGGGSNSASWNTELNAQVVNNVHDAYLPSWLPEGLKATQSSLGDRQCTLTYKGNGQTIRFTQYDNKAKILNDNEVAAMQKISIQSQTYYYSEKSRSGSVTRKLIWATQNNNFELDSTGSKDDLFKIAQGIVFKKG